MNFSNKLVSWYKVNKRDLPWRNTTNAYYIWLSEIILQQTRVEQGLPYYLAFLKAYPKIQHLANASEDDGFITTEKSLSEPWGVVQDSDGNTYVSSRNSRVIYKIDSSGNQTTYAGTGSWENSYVTDAQPVSLAKFRQIKSLAIDTSGSDDILYLVDERIIKKINLSTNLVYYITGDNQVWQNSFTNGDFSEAYFGYIEDITVSNDGSALYILDQNAIRKISDLSGDGLVETVSGQ